MYESGSDSKRYVNRFRRCCDVISLTEIGGQTIPMWIMPQNCNHWIAVHVKSSERKAAKWAGGTGIAFQISFVGTDGKTHEYDLFLDRVDWFLELVPGIHVAA